MTFLLFSPLLSIAEDTEEIGNGVVVVEPTNDAIELYKRYELNSFRLLTKGTESANPFKQFVVSGTGLLKEIIWALTMSVGKFNAYITGFLFSFDMIEPIKVAMANFTTALSKNMVSLASSIGIIFVALIMVTKFIMEQNIKGAFRVFFVTFGMFLFLTLFSNSQRTQDVFDIFFSIDTAIEREFVKVNPTLNDTNEEEKVIVNNVPGNNETGAVDQPTVSELLASKIFKSNVYDPYLIAQYGTTDTTKIRNRKVKIQNAEYDRIGVLLDNDFSDNQSEKIEEIVTDYESETLKNKTIHYTSAVGNVFAMLFYGITNVVQTVVLVILAAIRVLIQFLQITMFPLSMFLVLLAMFIWIETMVLRIFKVMGMLIFAKAMVSFLVLFYASFVSLGYTAIEGVDNIFGKMITLILYVITPFAFYWLRFFFAGVLTGASGFGTLMLYMRHPRQSYKKDQAKSEQKQAESAERRRKEADRKKEEDKKRQERKADEPQDDNLRKVPATNQNQNEQSQESSARRKENDIEPTESNEDNYSPNSKSSPYSENAKQQAKENLRKVNRSRITSNQSSNQSGRNPNQPGNRDQNKIQKSTDSGSVRRSPKRGQSGVKNPEQLQKLPPRQATTKGTVRSRPQSNRMSVKSDTLKSNDNSKVFNKIPAKTLQRKSIQKNLAQRTASQPTTNKNISNKSIPSTNVRKVTNTTNPNGHIKKPSVKRTMRNGNDLLNPPKGREK